MAYQCPYRKTKDEVPGCKGAKGDGFPTIKGWKGHLSRSHGQWSEEQLAAIVGAAPPNKEQGRSEFLAEAEKIPGSETEGREKTAEGAVGTDERPSTDERPDPEPVKKVVPLKMKKLKKALSALPEMILKAKGITDLDEGDREIMEGAQEILEDMFGVSLEVPESALVIRSRWIALMFPIGAFFLVYLKHTFSFDMFKKKEGEEGVNGPPMP